MLCFPARLLDPVSLEAINQYALVFFAELYYVKKWKPLRLLILVGHGGYAQIRLYFSKPTRVFLYNLRGTSKLNYSPE